ncbi:ParB N-terminal domain-containing protein [Allokutzneria sp. A3M-2-11 16]|uniref:ParB/RepB/Spo0J family partition protein n=1 Tax=Allokutzneria sp. A3M-2-11 16 TaxID=2962043 RepID=UPI0020B7154B|nr:ParB N-terminal domain-containing protein [Allokutzneria sp. A3M-2-11 16]MCP3804798.1 ParB N-terminal domain-containing protein [Allokutzneria sp. A3M-2-11 16]
MQDDSLSLVAHGTLDASSAVPVPVRALLPCTASPRAEGVSGEHVRVLVESEAELPPIIVHRPSMRVIDGMHRLRAAMVRGQAEIKVVFYEGDVEDAFVVGVLANISHGLPLSLAERSSAARRIIGSHPQWSDRMIASVTGMSPRTVSAIRGRSAGELPHAPTRLGRDGRVRPLSSAQGRLRASELLTRYPDASLRQIAKEAGVAPSTVLDVRDRMRAGRDVLPDQTRVTDQRQEERRRAVPAAPPRREPPRIAWADALESLRTDPSLRFSETGRALLRWLDAGPHRADDQQRVVAGVPAHSRATIAVMARMSAHAWQEFADRLERLDQTPSAG